MTRNNILSFRASMQFHDLDVIKCNTFLLERRLHWVPSLYQDPIYDRRCRDKSG
jgi:hypothetical protein